MLEGGISASANKFIGNTYDIKLGGNRMLKNNLGGYIANATFKAVTRAWTSQQIHNLFEPNFKYNPWNKDNLSGPASDWLNDMVRILQIQ